MLFLEEVVTNLIIARCYVSRGKYVNKNIKISTFNIAFF